MLRKAADEFFAGEAVPAKGRTVTNARLFDEHAMIPNALLRDAVELPLTGARQQGYDVLKAGPGPPRLLRGPARLRREARASAGHAISVT